MCVCVWCVVGGIGWESKGRHRLVRSRHPACLLTHHDHSSAAVARQSQGIHGISANEHQQSMLSDWTGERCEPGQGGAVNVTHPSLYSACSRSRYVSHLLPITLPQVKQRTGMITAHTVRGVGEWVSQVGGGERRRRLRWAVGGGRRQWRRGRARGLAVAPGSCGAGAGSPMAACTRRQGTPDSLAALVKIGGASRNRRRGNRHAAFAPHRRRWAAGRQQVRAHLN